MDERLERKLREVGLSASDFGDARSAWQRMHDRFGTRATLLDRYALEAAVRGITVDELEQDVRARLTHEVLAAHLPGFEIVAGSERPQRDPVEIVEYDAHWSVRFEEWRERLSAALGRTAQRIEHIGSTSVPGLAAKPVIDVQVSVGDLSDESAYVPAIESVDIAFRSRDAEHRYFRPSSDRPRDVQVHVCQAGSHWERTHLLFRDYLRVHPDGAARYGRMKLELAARHRDDRIAYNEAKTEFILDELERAERWAAAIGWRA